MPTTEELLDLAPGIGQRASSVRFDLLDKTLAKVGTVSPDFGPGIPEVENNMNRSLKRLLRSVRLNASEQGDVDPFGHRLRPVWVLENGAEFPLGVFIFASIERLRWEWGLDADVAGVDQNVILDQPLPHGVAYDAGADVRSAIEEQLTAALVPSFVVDPDIGTQVANPIAWPAGTSRLTVVNELAALAGAYSVFFDNSGVGRVLRVTDLSFAAPTLIYDRGGRIIEGSIVETDNLLDAPNQYIVIDSSDPEQAIVGTFDVPDEEPNSRLNRGFVIAAPPIQEQGLASVEQANARAAAAYAQAGSAYAWAHFASPPDPRHDTYDAVLYLGNVYREQRWSLPLQEGAPMIHDLRRAFEAAG